MARSTVHYHDNGTNRILKALHNKLRPAGTPIERVEYIIELLLLRIFEVKLKQEEVFKPLCKLFEGENYRLLFSYLRGLTGEQALAELNKTIFPFYASILNHAREVIKGNLPAKLQDYLVLTEEVFTNSSFTNNVKGGLMSEIIGLVSELDEQVVLKTDLLGDAIESALSETGGTKDIGLYRTPGHIRKMMVEMVDPDFTDTIHDPACGTGGFLFDAYDYIIDKAEKSDTWPSDDIIEQFYRNGLSGVEYLGRIRKMSAVNMYIRGLNPHNIEQGDSLKLYDPGIHREGYSVVIANPPFGAECDQPAYPNVWEEYSREKETTILFVKLMFDLLKKGGRCAVVVSEGFLTWGQTSACKLRQLLLQEANLKAIISLPQGVFVSKNGQGPKTSILYFEKGMPTDPRSNHAGTSFVWYYKIENDGFSMGTNRQPIEGSQIPELLKIWKSVKQGKIPEDTRHSFCIPRKWIETLDPRVKDRIRSETRERLVEKDKPKRAKFIEKLEQDLKKKKTRDGQGVSILKELYDEKLAQYDELFEVQVQNTIAKEIEKAHTYHFNLQNYRSNLTKEQIKKWQEIFHLNNPPTPFDKGEYRRSSDKKEYQRTTIIPPTNDSQIPLKKGGKGVVCPPYQRGIQGDVMSLDEQYNQLTNCHSELISGSPEMLKQVQYDTINNALKILSTFDPRNALEMDIAREFLHKLPKEVLEGNETLKWLEEIVRKGFQYPLVPLRDLIIINNEKIKPVKHPNTEFVVLGVSNQSGIFINEKLKGKEIRQVYYRVYKNQFCYNPYRINVGSIGLNEFDYENQIISGAYNVFGVNEKELTPKYLEALFKTSHFNDYVNLKACGGVRMDFRIEYMQDWQIPLPSLEIQREIVAKIEKQKAIIESAKRIEESWEIDVPVSEQKKPLSEFITDSLYGISSSLSDTGKYPVLRMNNLDQLGRWLLDDLKYIDDEIPEERKLCKGDFIFNRTNSIDLVGKCGVIDFDFNGTYAGYLIRFKLNDRLNPYYLRYLFVTKRYRQYFSSIAKPAGGQANINAEQVMTTAIDYFPSHVQQEIVAKLDREMDALEGVRLLRQEAEKRIEGIIAEVWREEN